MSAVARAAAAVQRQVAAVEPKVKAASAGAAVTGLVLWALGTYAFHGAVPGPVDAAVLTLGPGAVAAVAGWWARHVDRPGEPPAGK